MLISVIWSLHCNVLFLIWLHLYMSREDCLFLLLTCTLQLLYEETSAYCTGPDFRLIQWQSLYNHESISNRSLLNRRKSFSFNCRGQYPFKQKLQRVHIALKRVDNTFGLTAHIVLYSLPLHRLISKAAPQKTYLYCRMGRCAGSQGRLAHPVPGFITAYETWADYGNFLTLSCFLCKVRIMIEPTL